MDRDAVNEIAPTCAHDWSSWRPLAECGPLSLAGALEPEARIRQCVACYLIEIENLGPVVVRRVVLRRRVEQESESA